MVFSARLVQPGAYVNYVGFTGLLDNGVRTAEYRYSVVLKLEGGYRRVASDKNIKLREGRRGEEKGNRSLSPI